MALATTPAQASDSTYTLSDGTGVPVTLSLTCVQGGTSPMPAPNAHEYRCRDGSYSALRDGPTDAFDITIEMFFYEWTNGTAGAVLDFCRQANGYSGNTSTNTALGYVFDYIITTADRAEQTTDAVITYSDCRFISAEHTIEQEGDSLTITLRCYGGFAVTGEA